VEDISDLFNQQGNKGKESERFYLAMDKSNDTGDTAQLLIIVIHGIKESYAVVLKVCMA
jgi:hypothetical protein